MRDRERKIRLYAPELASAAEGDHLPLSEAEAHHALHVLRLRAGDEVEVFDGLGSRARAVFRPAGRSDAGVELSAPAVASRRPSPAVRLAFAVPKGPRLDWLLEKATELAAQTLLPILFERSLVGREELSANKRQRWLGQCVSAAKQSDLDFLPELREPTELGEFLALRPEGLLLVGDPSPDARSLPEALLAMPNTPSITLLVGPEGGITAAEMERIRQAGFVPVRLGSTVLRVETAALALLAAVRALR